MKVIPTLNIEQFEEEASLSEFYSNHLDTHLTKNKNIIHKPHRHDFFLCVIFKKGSGVHEIDFDSYPITNGSVFFLKPGQTHSWTFDNSPEGYIFFHTQEFYSLFFSNKSLAQFPFYYSYKNPPNLILKVTELKKAISLFKEINTEFYQKLSYQKQKIANLVNLLYIDLSRSYAPSEPSIIISSNYISTLETLEQAIEEFFKTQKSVAFYASHLHITTKHLNRITKTTLNKTPTELITERILLEAKRLMVHTDNTLNKISEILGYTDYAYFSRLFKQKTGITPLQFKKRY
ncbi:AraC family transcriptional regulator [uncultured Maribacter sp.]|uniref:AraC family transcriptional regulator n=1 Tax=uncultured Maribacter sp. TaxID=431308 RepID=UPI00261C6D3E|nr:AraC family transcriptional regulator [uncultured Maribacter sp.]